MKWIAWKRVVKNWNGKEGESVIGILASGLGNDNGDQTNWQRSEKIDNSDFTNSKNKTVNFIKFLYTRLSYNSSSSYLFHETLFSRQWVNSIERKVSHQCKIKNNKSKQEYFVTDYVLNCMFTFVVYRPFHWMRLLILLL